MCEVCCLLYSLYNECPILFLLMRGPIAGTVTYKTLSVKDAEYSRDTFAKSLYGFLFKYIVNQINVVLSDNRPNIKASSASQIGVLDIFGFEFFDANNSLEQLCINYANEVLQVL